jgi:hypothetical protein
MRIKITHERRFDEGGRLFGPGEWNVSNKIAASIIRRGYGVSLEGNQPTEQPVKTTSPAGPAEDTSSVTTEPVVEGTPPPKEPEHPTQPMSPIEAATHSDIPADFPERDKLIAAGITTVAQLKEEGVKDRIDAIAGIGPATITKIGLAITELP